MRKQIFKRDSVSIPMNLQLFAENGDGDGAGTGEGEGGGAVVSGDAGQGSPKTKTFDELLTEGHQAEFDRRIQKALGTAKDKWESLLDDKLSEAEKLAKMTKEEKVQYQHQKREKELSDKEVAITRRELMAEAKVTLTDNKLPVSLAEVLNYSDADTCKSSIESVSKAFREAVEAGVEERLKGGKPLKKAPGQDDADMAKNIEAIMMGM